MEKKKRFRRTRRLAGRALAYEDNKKAVTYIKDIVQESFLPPKEDQVAQQSFQDLNLSDAQINRMEKNLKKSVMTMLFFLVLGLIFLVLEVIDQHWMGTLVALLFVGVMGILAYRYHFWLFQLKQRKLGCTFDEWVNSMLGRKQK